MDFIMLDMWKEQNAGFECVCMCVLLQAGGKRELLGKKGDLYMCYVAVLNFH